MTMDGTGGLLLMLEVVVLLLLKVNSGKGAGLLLECQLLYLIQTKVEILRSVGVRLLFDPPWPGRTTCWGFLQRCARLFTGLILLVSGSGGGSRCYGRRLCCCCC